MKLDLHGIRHEDVRRKLDVFLWDSMQRKIRNVEVITGHSYKMKEIVSEVCQEYGFEVSEGIINKGYLTIEL